jgi:hypothetical protein
MGWVVSVPFSKAMCITGTGELRNPKTMMKMNGKRMLNTMADGLLKMERRLALAMAIIALY